jgi:hypothetical protein
MELDGQLAQHDALINLTPVVGRYIFLTMRPIKNITATTTTTVNNGR